MNNDNLTGFYLWVVSLIILILVLGTPKYTGNAVGILVASYNETLYNSMFTLNHPSWSPDIPMTLEDIDGNSETEW